MQIGDIFDGRYLILRTLGRGGMGTVYLAKNIKTDTYWAIKEISKNDGGTFELPAEPKLLKKLEHPSLPRLFDILEQDGKLYMVSDYIKGISLDKKLEKEGRIPEDTVIEWAIQLCRALDYLHNLKPNPIIYRDMKPSNIMLTESGTLKLIDFGIAREFKPYSEGDTVYIGTRGFAAPEQYGTGQTSAASDIFSLGVTLHQLLTGKNPAEPPYGLKPVRYYNSDLSPEIERIICKCTRESINERYQSAAELLKALESLKEERSRLKSGDNACECRKSGIPEGKYPLRIRKKVITIWDNAEFGCELAYMAAKHTKGEVMLIDLDLFAPKADLFLNVKKYPGKTVQGGLYDYSGLDIVMNAIGKGVLSPELLQQAAVRRKELSNLHILTGSYRLDNYEYFSEDSVIRLIEKSYRIYDITILLVNRWIYDAFTLSALLKSDINIAAVRGDIDVLREFNTYIAFLKDKQKLPVENTRFVLFEYDKEMGLGINEVNEATGGCLIGKIPPSRRRAMYRNLKGAYVSRMEKEMEKEYVRLLEKLELIPVPGTFQKLGLLFAHYFGQENRNKRKPEAEMQSQVESGAGKAVAECR